MGFVFYANYFEVIMDMILGTVVGLVGRVCAQFSLLGKSCRVTRFHLVSQCSIASMSPFVPGIYIILGC